MKKLCIALIFVSLLFVDCYASVEVNYDTSPYQKIKHTVTKVKMVKSKILNMKATAYWEGSCGKLPSNPSYGICSRGYNLNRKTWRQAMTVAAPPSFKIGTRLKITFPKRLAKYNGIYTVRDRGGAIKGNLLDVFMDTQKRCVDFGRTTIKVVVIK